MMSSPLNSFYSADESGSYIEVEALKAIFVRELQVSYCENTNTPKEISINLHPATADNTHEQYVRLTLVIELPPNYPQDLPGIRIRNPRGLSDEDLDRIMKDLVNKSKENQGNAMLYELIEVAKEHLTMGNTPRCSCAICLYGFSQDDVFIRTECYHYYHSHCLHRYIEFVLSHPVTVHPLAEHDANPKISVACPVCREPIDHSLETLVAPPPVHSENAADFRMDANLVQLQQQMATLFSKQKSKGGIIDIEAEKNKFLLEISSVHTSPDPSAVFVIPQTLSGVANIRNPDKKSNRKEKQKQQQQQLNSRPKTVPHTRNDSQSNSRPSRHRQDKGQGGELHEAEKKWRRPTASSAGQSEGKTKTNVKETPNGTGRTSTDDFQTVAATPINKAADNSRSQEVDELKKATPDNHSKINLSQRTDDSSLRADGPHCDSLIETRGRGRRRGQGFRREGQRNQNGGSGRGEGGVADGGGGGAGGGGGGRPKFFSAGTGNRKYNSEEQQQQQKKRETKSENEQLNSGRVDRDRRRSKYNVRNRWLGSERSTDCPAIDTIKPVEQARGGSSIGKHDGIDHLLVSQPMFVTGPPRKAFSNRRVPASDAACHHASHKAANSHPSSHFGVPLPGFKSRQIVGHPEANLANPPGFD